MDNILNRDLFKGDKLSEAEILRRLNILTDTLYLQNEILKQDLDSLTDSVASITEGTKFTGVIFAISADSSTVKLQVTDGKIKTITADY